ncbi:MarR family winged helix-turn-helix transcriptional regulator [Zavarzinia sp. CC-PAN008]|uniref:MarR family winged helix-turn-helix transcriptional regulator n=1 Tax=Zavarzinia sp. CC-PAN008 TaxID=3243332 RepID=UPI003F7488FA
MSETIARPNPLFLREEDLRQGIELLFFAYRYFTADPDEILAQKGFGRAHHRVLHFLGRHPGISVAELLAILGITKQSLSRVLAQLVDEGYVVQEADAGDRRRRLLRLTDQGEAFEREVSAPQRARVTRAYREAGAEAVAGYRKVLLGLIDEKDRDHIMALVERS